MAPHLDEKQRRLLAGSLAEALGRGGSAFMTRASGMSRNTVMAGQRAVAAKVEPTERVRAEGGGRPRLIDVDPDVLTNLDDLVEPDARGDPMSSLRWTLKSTRQLATALKEMGHQISSWTVGQLLHQMGYSLQATAKTVEGARHPDRDAQFRHINDAATARLAAGEPVISCDTKKKELVVGKKANGGREWQPKGRPEKVDVHDFPDDEVPKAVPYGVYDIGADEGWMQVGSDHDTAEFAVNAIRRWWSTMGKERYPKATRLMVTADAGGSNGYRNKLWKVELTRLAQETGLEITVCHYPPGTSKWNKVEHRMFSFVTVNWRGRPLTSYRTIVELAAATTTRTGLRIRAEWDDAVYQTGTKVSDNTLKALPIQPDTWHGEWNYTVMPTGASMLK
ncbi:MAG TPA: ISAzo13 family transposase [Acidimicrobiales bacterium]|nr:ISAzo13 family transposase [Acidimicrobiales bacterium]